MMKYAKTGIVITMILSIVVQLSGCSIGVNLKENDAMLLQGILRENHEQISEAIELGGNINKIEGMGTKEANPIQIAFKEQKYKLIKYLVNKGADPNYKTNGKVTILMQMAKLGEKDVCDFLIKKGAKIGAVDFEGNSALEYAVKGNNGLYFIDFLVENGAKITEKTWKEFLDKCEYNEYTGYKYALARRIIEELKKDGVNAKIDPDLEAAISGNSSLVQQYVKSGKIKNKNTKQVLFNAAAFCDLDTVKALNDDGIDLKSKDEDKNSLLIIASGYGSLETVKYLVSKGMDVNYENLDKLTPIIAAVRANKPEIVKYLVEHGADLKMTSITQNTECAFLEAVKYDDIEIVNILKKNGLVIDNSAVAAGMQIAVKYESMNALKLLLDSGFNPDLIEEDSQGTALRAACNLNKFDAVKLLIEKEADANGVDSEDIPLATAVQFSDIEVIKYLIEKGANVNKVSANKDVPTTLSSAILNGDFDIVKLFVEKGVDLEYEHPIFDAAYQGSSGILEYLIQKGAKINPQSKSGYTPLMGAAEKGYTKNVKVLLKYNADTKMKNEKGLTALDLARKNKKNEVIKILEKY